LEGTFPLQHASLFLSTTNSLLTRLLYRALSPSKTTHIAPPSFYPPLLFLLLSYKVPSQGRPRLACLFPHFLYLPVNLVRLPLTSLVSFVLLHFALISFLLLCHHPMPSLKPPDTMFSPFFSPPALCMVFPYSPPRLAVTPYIPWGLPLLREPVLPH